jgi:hypothetical protein
MPAYELAGGGALVMFPVFETQVLSQGLKAIIRSSTGALLGPSVRAGPTRG